LNSKVDVESLIALELEMLDFKGEDSYRASSGEEAQDDDM
jgi:hypothetical protein